MSLTTQQHVVLSHVNNMTQQVQHATSGFNTHNSQKLNLAMRDMQKRASMGQDVHESMKQVHNLFEIQKREAQNSRFVQPHEQSAGRFGANPARPGYHTGTSMPTGNAPGHLSPALSHDQINTFNHGLNKMAALTGHANYFHH